MSSGRSRLTTPAIWIGLALFLADVKLSELIATLSLRVASISIPNLRRGIVNYQSAVARPAARELTISDAVMTKRHERLARVFLYCQSEDPLRRSKGAGPANPRLRLPSKV